MKFQTPKGTRDFLPDEMSPRKEITDKIQKIYRLFGFKKWDGPAFEYLETLTLKSGENIKDEIYSFKDKSGRDLGLRFELTASLARMIAANPGLKKPLKLYNIGKVWRYERPQSGRFREFFQADADILGVSEITAEAELLIMATQILDELGFKNYQIILNNRKILMAVLNYLKISLEDQKPLLRALDKLNKNGKEATKNEIKKIISESQQKKLFEILEISGENQNKLAKMEKLIGQEEGIEELQNLLALLSKFSFSQKVRVDFSLVRGLDYYTGSIFEIVLPEDKSESIAGGGRYDNLIKLYGGQDTPACGISFGIERLFGLNKKTPNNHSGTDVYVCFITPDTLPVALKTASKIRQNGISADLALGNKSLTKQLQYANSIKASYAYILFSDKESILKDMKTGKEEKIFLNEAIEKLIKLFR